MATPITLAKAGAPLAAAAVTPDLFISAVASACLIAAACLWRLRKKDMGGRSNGRLERPRCPADGRRLEREYPS